MQAALPDVGAALERLVLAPETRSGTLATLLAQRTSLDAKVLEPIVSRAAAALLAAGSSPADRSLGLRSQGRSRSRASLQQVSASCVDAAAAGDVRRAAVRCLREMGAMSGDTGRAVLAAAGDGSCPAGRGDRRVGRVAGSGRLRRCSWPPGTTSTSRSGRRPPRRSRGSKEGAAALVAAMADDSIEAGSLPVATVADMRAVLGGNAALEKIWADLTAGATAVLRLAGGDTDAAAQRESRRPVHRRGLGESRGADRQPRQPARRRRRPRHELLRRSSSGCGRSRSTTSLVARRKALPGTWTHYAVTRDAEGCARALRQRRTRLRGDRARHDSLPRPADRLQHAAERRHAGPRRRVSRLGPGPDGRRDPGRLRPQLRRATERGRRAWSRFTAARRGANSPGRRRSSRPSTRRGSSPRPTCGPAPKSLRGSAGLAEAGGDPTRGQGLFATKCLTCHQQGGQGGRIGPALDGLGLTGVEAILRHVLTPSAAMEGGYRSFRVVTRDGRVIQGLLVSTRRRRDRDPPARRGRHPHRGQGRRPGRLHGHLRDARGAARGHAAPGGVRPVRAPQVAHREDALRTA